MPLMHGGKKAVSANIHELHEANKGRSKPRGNKQIVAIARAVEAQQQLGVTTSSATTTPTGSATPSASVAP